MDYSLPLSAPIFKMPINVDALLSELCPGPAKSIVHVVLKQAQTSSPMGRGGYGLASIVHGIWY